MAAAVAKTVRNAEYPKPYSIPIVTPLGKTSEETTSLYMAQAAYFRESQVL